MYPYQSLSAVGFQFVHCSSAVLYVIDEAAMASTSIIQTASLGCGHREAAEISFRLVGMGVFRVIVFGRRFPEFKALAELCGNIAEVATSFETMGESTRATSIVMPLESLKYTYVRYTGIF